MLLKATNSAAKLWKLQKKGFLECYMYFSIGYKYRGRRLYMAISGCYRKQKDPESFPAFEVSFIRMNSYDPCSFYYLNSN